MSLPEVHLVGGTQTEAVRLAPVATAVRDAGLLTPVLVAAGHHPPTVAQTLGAFGLGVDVSLPVGPEIQAAPEPEPVRQPDGLWTEPLTRLVRQLDDLWADRRPAAVIVQGATTTSLAGALAAAQRRIPVVHLQAGLRAADLDALFPEEADRRLIAQLAELHLAPTPLAAMNLLDENIAPGNVLVTGNTAVDAALAVAGQERPFENPELAAARAASGDRRLVFVSVHRHESRGHALDRVLAAVRILAARCPDIEVVLPSDPDPTVRAQVDAALHGVERITVTRPLSYADRSRLLAEAYLVLTDSGSILEQAPSFGVPALVLRDATERVESLEAGCARLVGTDTGRIVMEASRLLDSRVRRDSMATVGNPYGDGLAARRTAEATAALLGLPTASEPAPEARPSTLGHGPAPVRPRWLESHPAGRPAAPIPQVAAVACGHAEEDVARGYAQSWIDGDRHAMRRLLAPDVEVEWNLDLPVDDEELVQTLHWIAVFATEVTVVSRVCTGAAATHVYDCATMFGTVRFAEFLTLADGQVTEVRQVFDVVGLNRYFPGLLDGEPR
ncbi:non-hydrolyzing UDP-N-acetylglucosamine 2-epimerase [Krasilnikovia sp. MM14-A1259]|uniref:non-hydrolyzing UDP-N-acetylglucosamine 2-epimerase n=1 Tax=Krasilnikovia sp. MM14-A1259 TaxID=3373539 RepID=UPI0037F3AB0A